MAVGLTQSKVEHATLDLLEGLDWRVVHKLPD